MNEKMELLNEEVRIANLIYNIRGKQVMLDSDLAMLYQVETKNLNKAMKRNQKRFPEDFCFQLIKEEFDNLRFQFGTSSLKDNYGGRRYNMYIRNRELQCYQQFSEAILLLQLVYE